jgi:hypothetical protein
MQKSLFRIFISSLVMTSGAIQASDCFTSGGVAELTLPEPTSPTSPVSVAYLRDRASCQPVLNKINQLLGSQAPSITETIGCVQNAGGTLKATLKFPDTTKQSVNVQVLAALLPPIPSADPYWDVPIYTVVHLSGAPGINGSFVTEGTLNDIIPNSTLPPTAPPPPPTLPFQESGNILGSSSGFAGSYTNMFVPTSSANLSAPPKASTTVFGVSYCFSKLPSL